MVQSLISLRGVSATEAGIMASAHVFGYMLAVPVLTKLQGKAAESAIRPTIAHPMMSIDLTDQRIATSCSG
jgi:hypothetical protein